MMYSLLLGLALFGPFTEQESSPQPGDQARTWVEQLGAPYYEDRQKARTELERLGKTAEPHLIFGLGSDDFRVKRACIDLLGKMKSQKAVKPVGKLFMDDSDEGIRIAAFRFLKEFGQASEPFMIKALEINDEDVRLDAIRSLSQNKSKAALPMLASLYKNKDALKTIRDECFAYLLAMGDQAGEDLIEALKTEDEQRKFSIMTRFRETKYERALDTVVTLLDGNPSQVIQNGAFDYFDAIGAAAEPQWIKLLKNGKSDVRRRAIKALGQIRSEAALEGLAALLTDAAQDIRTAAEEALVLYGPKGLEALDAVVKEGRITQDVVDRLRAGYDEREVVGRLEQLIANNTYGFYEGQFKTLKDLDQKKVIPVLMKLVKATTSGKADKEILRWLQKSPNLVLGLSLMALAELGNAGAAKELKTLVNEEHERIKSDRSLFVDFATTLHKLGDPSVFDELIEELKKNEETDDPNTKYDSIFFQGVAYNRVGEIDQAEKIYRELIEKVGEETEDTVLKETVSANAWYNLACLDSIRGKKRKAIESLKKAIENKYTNEEWMELDGDLNNLRNEPEFKEILRKLRNN